MIAAGEKGGHHKKVISSSKLKNYAPLFLLFFGNISYFPPIFTGEKILFSYYSGRPMCWAPCISSHDIDYIEYVGPSLTGGRIWSTCVKSMWRNDIKCKYMFMFPLKNLARKGLMIIAWTLVQVMDFQAWHHQAASRCLSQCWPKSMASLGHNELNT